jgi:short-subunit dehydrogenase
VISWSPAERISASFSASISLIRAVLKESRKRFNVAVIHVDLFVNNAGFSLSGEFLSHDPRQEQAEVEVNVQVLVALTYHFAKAMAARGRVALNATSNAASVSALHGWLCCDQSFRSPLQRAIHRKLAARVHT